MPAWNRVTLTEYRLCNSGVTQRNRSTEGQEGHLVCWRVAVEKKGDKRKGHWDMIELPASHSTYETQQYCTQYCYFTPAFCEGSTYLSGSSKPFSTYCQLNLGSTTKNTFPYSFLDPFYSSSMKRSIAPTRLLVLRTLMGGGWSFFLWQTVSDHRRSWSQTTRKHY